jgi:hypothetical protein
MTSTTLPRSPAIDISDMIGATGRAHLKTRLKGRGNATAQWKVLVFMETG